MILLDLFSGIGGFHLGLERAGFDFEEVYFSEIDQHAIACYKHNFKNIEYVGDVKSISTSGIRRPNIITFGSPCQNFSMAGRREGLGGRQSSLIKYALAAISKFRPDVFIWENVKGAFSSNNSEDFWAIIQAFANLGGYRLEWQLLNTSWVLPQNRERIYLVGHLTESFRNWRPIFPIAEDDFPFRKEGNRKLQGATISRSITSNYAKMGGDNTYILSRGRGFCEDSVSEVCPTIRGSSFEHNTSIIQLNKEANWGGTVRQNDRIYSDKGIMACIPSASTECKVNIKTGSHIRRLTEIECERLQGFPDDWTKYGDYGEVKEIAKTNRYKLIGNAVTVNIVELVAKRIKINYDNNTNKNHNAI